MRLKNTSRVGRECARPRRGDYGSTTLMTTTTSMVTSHSKITMIRMCQAQVTALSAWSQQARPVAPVVPVVPLAN
jgi:hypothetical protein